MIDLHPSIFKLNPTVTHIVGDIAYDAEGNEVAYDLAAVTTQATADQEAQASAKASALAKLSKLGLTEDEIKALL